MINVASVTRGLLSQPFTVFHPAENNWSDARINTANQGVIFHSSQDNAQFSAEGTRLHNTLRIYAEKTVMPGDNVLYRSQYYKVVHSQDYAEYGYYYALAVLINEPANPAGTGFIDT